MEIPGLAYDPYLDQTVRADSITAELLSAFYRRWPQGPDIIHVHNPTLAKNSRLQAVLKRLQHKGLKLLCQIHDFAEDGRPDFFFNEEYVPDCHYAVLNQRDYNLLLNAGLTAAGLHLLPNPVTPVGKPNTIATRPGEMILYPVRALRRKNVGEALLLSLLLRDSEVLAITLPPNSPQDTMTYNGWRQFASRHCLRVIFEAGMDADFNELMSRARYVLTTSITEGFGHAFLEAWTAGKTVWGRLLPDICQDFINHGLLLDHLYRRLSVPLRWLAVDQLAQQWQQTLSMNANRFGYPLAQEALELAWREISKNGCIDFGLLDEVHQRQAIEHLLANAAAADGLLVMNPALRWTRRPDDEQNRIIRNQSVVAKHYGLNAYARRLNMLYRDISTTSVHQRIDRKRLVKAFLNPERFSLLKWSPLGG